MSTTADNVRQAIIDAIRGSEVAVAAGVDWATWSSSTTPRVFDGDGAPIGSRNRGRLPFVEVLINRQPFTLEGQGIGNVVTNVGLRIHVGGFQRSVAQQLAEGIMASSFAAVRVDNYYFAIGGSSFDSMNWSPGWSILEASMTVQHSYDPTTFEAT